MAHECHCHHDAPVALGTAAPAARPEETVAEIVRLRPGAFEVLQRLGINHCCGAHLTLREAAAAAGVPVETVLASLGTAPGPPA